MLCTWTGNLLASTFNRFASLTWAKPFQSVKRLASEQNFAGVFCTCRYYLTGNWKPVKMGTDIFSTSSFQFQVQYLQVLSTISVLFKYVNLLILHQWILGMEPSWDFFFLLAFLLRYKILFWSSPTLSSRYLDFTK